MNIQLRYCRRCMSPFDIGVGDLCPKCRREAVGKIKEEVEEDAE